MEGFNLMTKQSLEAELVMQATELNGGHLEIVDGIHLPGQEAPAVPVDALLHRALLEDLEMIRERPMGGRKFEVM